MHIMCAFEAFTRTVFPMIICRWCFVTKCKLELPKQNSKYEREKKGHRTHWWTRQMRLCSWILKMHLQEMNLEFRVLATFANAEQKHCLVVFSFILAEKRKTTQTSHWNEWLWRNASKFNWLKSFTLALIAIIRFEAQQFDACHKASIALNLKMTPSASSSMFGVVINRIGCRVAFYLFISFIVCSMRMCTDNSLGHTVQQKIYYHELSIYAISFAFLVFPSA